MFCFSGKKRKADLREAVNPDQVEAVAEDVIQEHQRLLTATNEVDKKQAFESCYAGLAKMLDLIHHFEYHPFFSRRILPFLRSSPVLAVLISLKYFSANNPEYEADIDQVALMGVTALYLSANMNEFLERNAIIRKIFSMCFKDMYSYLYYLFNRSLYLLGYSAIVASGWQLTADHLMYALMLFVKIDPNNTLALASIEIGDLSSVALLTTFSWLALVQYPQWSKPGVSLPPVANLFRRKLLPKELGLGHKTLGRIFSVPYYLADLIKNQGISVASLTLMFYMLQIPLGKYTQDTKAIGGGAIILVSGMISILSTLLRVGSKLIRDPLLGDDIHETINKAFEAPIYLTALMGSLMASALILGLGETNGWVSGGFMSVFILAMLASLLNPCMDVSCGNRSQSSTGSKEAYDAVGDVAQWVTIDGKPIRLSSAAMSVLADCLFEQEDASESTGSDFGFEHIVNRHTELTLTDRLVIKKVLQENRVKLAEQRLEDEALYAEFRKGGY